MSLAELLREKRKGLNLGQEDLARKCDLKLGVVMKIEQGTVTDPRWSTMVKLAKGLGCTLDDFVADEKGRGRKA